MSTDALVILDYSYISFLFEKVYVSSGGYVNPISVFTEQANFAFQDPILFRRTSVHLPKSLNSFFYQDLNVNVGGLAYDALVFPHDNYKSLLYDSSVNLNFSKGRVNHFFKRSKKIKHRVLLSKFKYYAFMLDDLNYNIDVFCRPYKSRERSVDIFLKDELRKKSKFWSKRYKHKKSKSIYSVDSHLTLHKSLSFREIMMLREKPRNRKTHKPLHLRFFYQAFDNYSINNFRKKKWYKKVGKHRFIRKKFLDSFVSWFPLKDANYYLASCAYRPIGLLTILDNSFFLGDVYLHPLRKQSYLILLHFLFYIFILLVYFSIFNLSILMFVVFSTFYLYIFFNIIYIYRFFRLLIFIVYLIRRYKFWVSDFLLKFGPYYYYFAKSPKWNLKWNLARKRLLTKYSTNTHRFLNMFLKEVYLFYLRKQIYYIFLIFNKVLNLKYIRYIFIYTRYFYYMVYLLVYHKFNKNFVLDLLTVIGFFKITTYLIVHIDVIFNLLSIFRKVYNLDSLGYRIKEFNKSVFNFAFFLSPKKLTCWKPRRKWAIKFNILFMIMNKILNFILWFCYSYKSFRFFYLWKLVNLYFLLTKKTFKSFFILYFIGGIFSYWSSYIKFSNIVLLWKNKIIFYLENFISLLVYFFINFIVCLIDKLITIRFVIYCFLFLLFCSFIGFEILLNIFSDILNFFFSHYLNIKSCYLYKSITYNPRFTVYEDKYYKNLLKLATSFSFIAKGVPLRISKQNFSAIRTYKFYNNKFISAVEVLKLMLREPWRLFYRTRGKFWRRFKYKIIKNQIKRVIYFKYKSISVFLSKIFEIKSFFLIFYFRLFTWRIVYLNAVYIKFYCLYLMHEVKFYIFYKNGFIAYIWDYQFFKIFDNLSFYLLNMLNLIYIYVKNLIYISIKFLNWELSFLFLDKTLGLGIIYDFINLNNEGIKYINFLRDLVVSSVYWIFYCFFCIIKHSIKSADVEIHNDSINYFKDPIIDGFNNWGLLENFVDNFGIKCDILKKRVLTYYADIESGTRRKKKVYLNKLKKKKHFKRPYYLIDEIFYKKRKFKFGKIVCKAKPRRPLKYYNWKFEHFRTCFNPTYELIFNHIYARYMKSENYIKTYGIERHYFFFNWMFYYFCFIFFMTIFSYFWRSVLFNDNSKYDETVLWSLFRSEKLENISWLFINREELFLKNYLITNNLSEAVRHTFDVSVLDRAYMFNAWLKNDSTTFLEFQQRYSLWKNDVIDRLFEHQKKVLDILKDVYFSDKFKNWDSNILTKEDLLYILRFYIEKNDNLKKLLNLDRQITFVDSRTWLFFGSKNYIYNKVCGYFDFIDRLIFSKKLPIWAINKDSLGYKSFKFSKSEKLSYLIILEEPAYIEAFIVIFIIIPFFFIKMYLSKFGIWQQKKRRYFRRIKILFKFLENFSLSFYLDKFTYGKDS